MSRYIVDRIRECCNEILESEANEVTIKLILINFTQDIASDDYVISRTKLNELAQKIIDLLATNNTNEVIKLIHQIALFENDHDDDELEIYETDSDDYHADDEI